MLLELYFFGISSSPCMTFKKCVVSFMHEGEVSTIGFRLWLRYFDSLSVGELHLEMIGLPGVPCLCIFDSK